jgi:hypothetical protein
MSIAKVSEYGFRHLDPSAELVCTLNEMVIILELRLSLPMYLSFPCPIALLLSHVRGQPRSTMLPELTALNKNRKKKCNSFP